MQLDRLSQRGKYAPQPPRRTCLPRILSTLPLVATLLAGCSEAEIIPPSDPVAVVEVSTPQPSIQAGDTVRLTARARSAAGTELPGRTFAWTSSDTLVARVSQTGLVTGVSPGQARIRAGTAGRIGETSIAVTVVPPEPPPPPPAPELAAIVPAQVLEREGALELSVEGAHFRNSSRVLWNEIPLPTTFVTETRLVARVPASFTGQPLEARISVETLVDFGVPPLPRSESRPLHVTPRPVASLTLRVAGNHLFRGQALEEEAELRNDLGEPVFRPGLGVELTNTTVANWDWTGQIRGRVGGTTILRYRFGALTAEAQLTVGTAPMGVLVVEASPNGISELFRLVFDRAGLQAVRIERILPMGTRGGEPALSPDGQRVAFSGTAPDGSVNIWTVGLDGTGLRRLTDDAFRADQPAWSPDGTRIAFRTFRRGGPELWVMRADGSDPRPVVTTSWLPAEVNQDPAWSPDGTRLLFSRQGSGQLELWAVRVDGALPATPTPFLAVAGHDLRHPSWHRDGNLVAFQARDGMTGSVRVLFAAGETGALVHPLFPPPEGATRPALIGGDWIGVVALEGMPGSTVPTLHVRQLNGLRISVPFPTWMGRVVAVAAPGG